MLRGLGIGHFIPYPRNSSKKRIQTSWIEHREREGSIAKLLEVEWMDLGQPRTNTAVSSVCSWE